MRQGREYVQPQWVYDSVNAAMMLPVNKYAPGVSLPVCEHTTTDEPQAFWVVCSHMTLAATPVTLRG